MKSLRCLSPGLAAILCMLPLLFAASALVANQTETSKPDELTPAEARKVIIAAYDRWGRARVELDKETMNAMLAPDFYVSLYGRTISREEFRAGIVRERPGYRLTRFDVDVLTVRKSEEGWTAVITERIESTMQLSNGETHKLCSLWVTRDGFRKEGKEWLVTFSEAIGHENWEPGTTPPIEGW